MFLPCVCSDCTYSLKEIPGYGDLFGLVKILYSARWSHETSEEDGICIICIVHLQLLSFHARRLL